MQEPLGHHDDGTPGSDPGKKADATTQDELLGKIEDLIVRKSNEVFHSGFTKRASTLEKSIQDLAAQVEAIRQPKPQEEESELMKLQRQVKDLSMRYEEAQTQIKDKEITNHLMTKLNHYKVNMPDVAMMVLKNQVQYEGGRVVAKDEYGNEIPTDKLIENLLDQKPGFRPPRGSEGTATRGGGGSRHGLPERSEPSDGSLSRDKLIEAAGGEAKAKELGWI